MIKGKGERPPDSGVQKTAAGGTDTHSDIHRARLVGKRREEWAQGVGENTGYTRPHDNTESNKDTQY